MAKERRDNKNRILSKGEYQKEDGRYMYRYTDANGKARFIYSWTLTKSDRTPSGKTVGPCLRDLEKEIAKDLLDEIDTFAAKKSTVDDYFEKYLQQRKKLKKTTRQNYRHKYNLYLKNRIGNRAISTIKYTDICKCYSDILEEHGIASATLALVDAILKPTLRLAVRDNLLKNNPSIGAFVEVTQAHNSKKNKKFALTVQQQNNFLDFIDKSKVYSKWKNFYTVMLGSGCRVGELCGLTWDDCDFENNILYIRRTLCYSPDEFTGKYNWSIQTTKTEHGTRSIPMFTEVKSALEDERKRRLLYGFCDNEIDGVSGFVFCNRNLGVIMPNEANKTLTRIVNAYNKKEGVCAKELGVQPIFLPEFSPHILRHTFCTRLCESGVDIKVVQEVMGHSNIAMTMDVYNNITMDHKQESFKRVDGIFKIV